MIRKSVVASFSSFKHNLFQATLLFTLLLTCQTFAEDPYFAVYLTWQKDPTTSMTVQWITENGKENDDLNYRKNGDASWKTIAGSHTPLPKEKNYLIHKAEITNLEPGTTYNFRLRENAGTVYKFRTLPKTEEHPIRFVVGGDMFHDNIESMIETHKQAAKANPMFALTGGDIAYGASKRTNEVHRNEAKRWLQWISAWSEHMKTEDGHLIPFLPCIGNHDVKGMYKQPKSNAPFFYTLFAFPGSKGYNVIDAGNYLSIVILDSGHTNSIQGDQTAWLKETLTKRRDVPNKFALYHVPAYPSVRKMKGENSTLEREHWVPLFEAASLSAAFENHDHAYKRTKPILKDKVDPKGVVYLGDGAWGVKNPREPKPPEKLWYLDTSKQERHFILVSIDKEGRSYKAIKPDGKIIDSYFQSNKKAIPAQIKEHQELLVPAGR